MTDERRSFDSDPDHATPEAVADPRAGEPVAPAGEPRAATGSGGSDEGASRATTGADQDEPSDADSGATSEAGAGDEEQEPPPAAAQAQAPQDQAEPTAAAPDRGAAPGAAGDEPAATDAAATGAEEAPAGEVVPGGPAAATGGEQPPAEPAEPGGAAAETAAAPPPAPAEAQAAETAAPLEPTADAATAAEEQQPAAAATSVAEQEPATAVAAGERQPTPAAAADEQRPAAAVEGEQEAAATAPVTTEQEPAAATAPVATEQEPATAVAAGEQEATAATVAAEQEAAATVAATTDAGEAAPAPAAAAEAAPPEPEEPEDPALAALREAREQGTPVEGRVIGWNRGGFHVVVGSVTAFCPSSEMEIGRPKSPASYVERSFPFKVIKYQKKGRRVVVSRAALLGEQRKEVLDRLSAGSVATGTVTSLPDFGAFVDLGGIEGLVHVSEISRGRVQHPKDALQVGQEVEVKVLKVEQGGERISLSIKDLEPDPWRVAGERFGRGDRFSGKVLRRTEFGLFVELEPEVEGLLHVSQLPPGKSVEDAAYQPGEPVEGWVREVDTKRQRISLSLREVPTEDPWKGIAQRFPEGESVEGVVESVAPFGVFITLAPGVTGLLPNSQTGLPRGSNAARAYSPGQTVRVQVVSVDQRRKRISLGREGTRVEASKTDLQDFKRRESERTKESKTAMAAAFARLQERRDER